MNLRYILIFLFVVAQGRVVAQAANPQRNTIQWNATGFRDQKTGASAQGASQFITYGSDKIEWVQRGGKLVYTLAVTSVDGAWTNAITDGSLTYHVVLNDKTGTITVTRTSGALSLTLQVQDGPDSIDNLYTITSLDIL